MKESFYNDSHRGDLSRIPLIDPMELISADDHEWLFKLPYGKLKDGTETIARIDKIGVLDSIIVIHSESMYYDSQMTELWIVIDVTKKEKTIALNLEDFESALKEAKVESIVLKQVKEVFEQFDQHQKLPWKPNI